MNVTDTLAEEMLHIDVECVICKGGKGQKLYIDILNFSNDAYIYLYIFIYSYSY